MYSAALPTFNCERDTLGDTLSSEAFFDSAVRA